MQKIFTTIFMTLVILLGIPNQFCYAKEQAPVDKKVKLTNVYLRLHWRHQSEFAGFYYADKAGFYKEAGLNVIMRPANSDFSVIPSVVNEVDDFGISSPDQILLAREKGVPVVAIAVIYQQTPAVIMSLRESNITQLSDLVGKKVGIIYGKDDELIYRAELRAANIDAKKIIEVPVRYDLSLLLQKKIDAILAYRISGVQQLIALGKPINLIYPADYGINFYADTLFTTEKMIKNNPELVRKFVHASLQGWEEALKNPQKAVEYSLIHMPYIEEFPYNIEATKFAASLPLIKIDDLPIGSMQKNVWESTQKLLLNFGFMRKKLDVTKAFTTEFLK